MNLQKINLKMFVDAPDKIPLDAFLPIFAKWRENRDHPARWVDLADYAHVPYGPGIMIVGHQGNLALDLADPGPGILYANKRDLDGEGVARILETFRRTLVLTTLLTGEAGYPDQLAPRPGFWQIAFNDRMDAPNNDDTDRRLRPAVEAALDRIFGVGRYTMVRDTDPFRRYGFAIHSDAVETLEQVAASLG